MLSTYLLQGQVGHRFLASTSRGHQYFVQGQLSSCFGDTVKFTIVETSVSQSNCTSDTVILQEIMDFLFFHCYIQVFDNAISKLCSNYRKFKTSSVLLRAMEPLTGSYHSIYHTPKARLNLSVTSKSGPKGHSVMKTSQNPPPQPLSFAKALTHHPKLLHNSD